MKTCRVCGESKPLTEFYKMNGMKDGHRHDCKPCHAKRRKARYGEQDIKNSRARAVRTRVVLDIAKTRAGCARCGYNESAVALDFNHFKGTKKNDITKLVTCSWSTIMAEVAKCVVLCANCHRVVTHSNNRHLEDDVATFWHEYGGKVS